MSKDFEKEPTLEKTIEPAKVKDVSKDRVMSVSQYLAKNKQDEGIQGLISSLYKKDIKTEKDWNTTVENLLSRNVK